MNTKLILVAICSALLAVVLTLTVQSHMKPPPSPTSTPATRSAPLAAPIPPAAAPQTGSGPNGNAGTAESTQAAAPQSLVLQSKYARIHYSPEYAQDAQEGEKCVTEAATELIQRFGDGDPGQFWSGIEFDIFLHPKATQQAQSGTSSLKTNSNNGKLVATMEMLTASSPENNTTGFVKEPNSGPRYARERFFSTVASLIFEQIAATKASGCKYYQSPDWFYSGLPHNIGISGTHGQFESDVEKKLFEELRAHPERVSANMTVQNRWRDGCVLMSYVVTTYGVEKIKKLLLSPEATFWQAAEKELGITPAHLYQNFYEWLTGKPAPSTGDF